MGRNQWTISAIVLLAGCGICLGLLASQASYARVAPGHGAGSRAAGVLLSSTGPGAGAQGTPTPTVTATGTPCAPAVVFKGSLDDTDPTSIAPSGSTRAAFARKGQSGTTMPMRCRALRNSSPRASATAPTTTAT